MRGLWGGHDPEKGGSVKRLWGIRHIRWLWYSYHITRWVEAWGALIMSERDRRILDAIWKGEL